MLGSPEVLNALGALSGNINELAIYRWGVELRYPASADADALHRDIENAWRIRVPMEKYRQVWLETKQGDR